ncbi:amino acid transporter [Lentinula aciculospora]|uniref:Amino acid transporter n=1 Tax=Lentinula aciculospora TaxID=153920 RepID=A0A9W9AGE7_9AGAR|nr:amino acid transporter [Lentinula aciculospora]
MPIKFEELKNTFPASEDGFDPPSRSTELGNSNSDLENLQHLTRVGTLLSSGSFALTSPLETSLISGGPATMLWSFVMVSAFTLPVAMSMGEICSKYPTSSGTYFWTYKLAPSRYRLLFSWVVGWLVTVGYWVVTLSVTFGTSQLILAGTNIYLPQWEATAWQTYLIFVLVVILTTTVAIVFDHWLPFLDIIAATWNLVGILVIVICLSVKASAGRHSAKYALTHFDASQSGWTPGWAFFIGMLPGAYTFLGVPTIVTMGEEIFDPSVNLPKAIVWAVPTGSLLGVIFLLPILFTLPDISVLLAAPEGQPEALVFELIMGSKAVFGLTILCGLSVTCATSRATWAFARDKAIPFHHVFANLGRGRWSDTPVNAYLLSAVIQLALGCIYLGSTAAFNSFVAVSIMCFGSSCAIPILLLLARRRKPVEDVPFSLGIWGYPLNVLAVFWIVFEMIIVSMPVSLPVERSDMNYASAVFVGFIAISALWYIIDGRHIYSGPYVPK